MYATKKAKIRQFDTTQSIAKCESALPECRVDFDDFEPHVSCMKAIDRPLAVGPKASIGRKGH